MIGVACIYMIKNKDCAVSEVVKALFKDTQAFYGEFTFKWNKCKQSDFV